jgi:hypothetical protein
MNSIGTVNVRSVAVNTLIQAGTSIRAVNVRGGVFSNSRIIAPVINTLNLGTIDNTTGSQLRVATADRIGVTTWRLAGGKTSRLIGLDAAGDQDLGGNMVLHIT